VGTFAATGRAPTPEPAGNGDDEDSEIGEAAAARAARAPDPNLQLGALALRFLPPNPETQEVAEKLPFLPKVLDGQLGRWSDNEAAALDVAVRRAAGALLFERALGELERQPEGQLSVKLAEFTAQSREVAQLDLDSEEVGGVACLWLGLAEMTARSMPSAGAHHTYPLCYSPTDTDAASSAGPEP